jgi:hypothetical protein
MTIVGGTTAGGFSDAKLRGHRNSDSSSSPTAAGAGEFSSSLALTSDAGEHRRIDLSSYPTPASDAWVTPHAAFVVFVRFTFVAV